MYTYLKKTTITIEDGDRGKNYPSSSDLNSNGYCLFLNNKNIINNKLVLSDAQYISKTKDNSMNKGSIRLGDIIMTTRGSLGNILLFDKNNYLPARINSGMVIIRAGNNYLNKYLYFFFQSPFFQNQILAAKSGSAQPQLPIKDISNMFVPVEPLINQQHIVDTIGSIDDLIEHNNALIKKLNNYIWLKFLKLKETISKNGPDNLLMKDLVNITTGKKNANAAVNNGKYAFFTCSLDDYKTDNYCFDCEAIIIAGNGAINVKYYKGKFDAYQRTYVITSNKYFFYCYCLYKDSINSLIAGSKGSVINFITLGMLQEINVKITNASVHKSFETECSILMNNICKLKDKNNQLEQLKKQYLNKFFG